MIAVHLGKNFECFIPTGMATELANAIIDCIETGTPTEYYRSCRGKTVTINGQPVKEQDT